MAAPGTIPSARPPRPGDAREMLAMARAFLERKQLAEARLEAELLVAHALGVDRLGLFLALDRPVEGEEIDRARDLLVRRGRREPVAYITGEREFYGRPFAVERGVLIPRPETELLVDLARDHAAQRAGGTSASGATSAGAVRLADLGTGSGCLATTLALELPEAEVFGLELSEEALAVARRNGATLGAQVDWRAGDGLALLDELAGSARFDLIVSNPPYVRQDERGELAPEVVEYEPELALFAPADDPDFWVREIVARSRAWLAPGGAVLVELGADQGSRALQLAQAAGLQARLESDLAGIERVLACSLPG